jgi:membrane protein
MAEAVEKQGGIVAGVKETFSHFSDKDAMSQAAAVAFYAGLSLAPILTVVAWIARNVFGGNSKQSIVQAFSNVLGAQAAEPIKQILDPASKQAEQSLTISGIISLILVVLSASGVFGQLQSALNNLWSVKAAPTADVWSYVQKRLFSVGMLLSILFLLLVSMVISAVVQGFIGTNGHGWWMVALNTAISLVLFTGLFGLMFRYVPDAKIRWRDVWVGGLISAVLFVIGKFGLGLYLGRGSYESSYGAAIGSFVALLVWVYYSSTILFVGAVATEVYARRHGNPVEPETFAEKTNEPHHPGDKPGTPQYDRGPQVEKDDRPSFA